MKRFFVWCLIALASFSAGVHAQTVSATPFQIFMAQATTFGPSTVGFSSTGAPLVSSASPVWSAPSFSQGGGAIVTTASKVAIGGKSIDVVVKGAATGQAVGAALGKFAAKVFTPLTVGVALYDLAKELGFTASNKLGGGTAFKKLDANGGNCYISESLHRCVSGAQMCAADYPTSTSVVYTNGYAECFGQGSFYGSRPPVAGPPVEVDATPQDFVDAIAAQSGWPSTSHLAPAVEAAIKAGETIEARPTQVTGPASLDQEVAKFNTIVQPLPSTTEVTTTPGTPSACGGPCTARIGNGYRDVRVEGVPQCGAPCSMSNQLMTSVVPIPTNETTSSVYNPGPDTTTTTRTKNYPGANVETKAATTTALAYDANSATQRTTTMKTVTVTDANGNPVTTTTTTDTTGKAATDADSTNPCKANPDSIGCGKLDTPELQIPKVSKTITFTPLNIFGGGSCPADKFMSLHTGQSIKVVDWATPCSYIATYVRPIILFLASFAAMMMLIPGRAES